MPPDPDVTFSAFADPSGGVNDSFTLAIGHLTPAGVGVLDVVREIRPPFSPDEAVAEYATLLRQYNISRVVGDRYAGLWVPARFSEHGITYEHSPRSKSQIYSDLLPSITAGRIELLENVRLTAQLCALERRTARGGRDSIDHMPGGRDDLINAAAGCLVGLDLDRRPVMVRQSALTVEGVGVPRPSRCSCVFAVMAVADDGFGAVVYVALTPYDAVKVTIVDFDVSPIDGETLARVAVRHRVLTGECGAKVGGMGVLLPIELHVQARAVGLPALVIPEELQDASKLALGAAGWIARGQVKVTAEVQEKAKQSPFGGALAFRIGDTTDSPLRVAALQAIVAALETDRPSRKTQLAR